MKAQPIVFERTYNAPVKKVWKALTDKSQMKQWYFEVSDFKPEVGFRFTFTGGTEEQQFIHLCEITEVIPFKKLRHSWRYEGYEGKSFVTWELVEEGKNKTRVKLTHEGLETFPNISAFNKKNFVAGWTEITGVLLLEFVEVADIVKEVTLDMNPEKLWPLLVTVEAVSQWAEAFSGGTKVESDFHEGSSIVWKDSSGEIGASGAVSERIEFKKIVFTYFEDEEQPENERYKEDFQLDSHNGKTILKVKAGPLSKKYLKVHDPLWNEALNKIKSMAYQ